MPVELQELANSILFESTLEAKLIAPDVLTDSNIYLPITAPEKPGRPSFLGFTPKQKGHAFPKKSSFESDQVRGFVLHFFANHELLAMELMALALLRFPDAPKDFRMGIARTILEERGHMLLYRKRMNELGVEFGDIPVNNFFWDILKDMKTPVDYCTRMAMTLEQANLDYSLHYRNEFQKIGDLPTAKILHQVYEEEIGHVKHGVIWYKKFHGGKDIDFTSFENHLKKPLSPRRARGIGFDKEGRRKAGFTEEFIEKLRVYSQSKGRPGNVYYFDPAFEDQVNRKKPGFTLSKHPRQLKQDYQHLNMFLCKEEDLILCSELPQNKWLAKLQAIGFLIPEFQNKPIGEVFSHRKFAEFRPWGWSVDAANFLNPYREHLAKPELFSRWRDERDFEAHAKVISKKFALEIRDKFIDHFGHEGVFEKDLLSQAFDTTADALQFIFSHNSTLDLVIKSPIGASGQNMFKVFKDEPVGELVEKRIDTYIGKYKAVIVEPWFDKIQDYSILLDLNPHRQTPFLGYTIAKTTHRGQHRHHVLGRRKFFLEPRVTKLTKSASMGFKDLCQSMANFTAKELAANGYFGFAGIDLFAYKNSNEDIKLRNHVEVNMRYTMGHIALALEKHIHSDSAAIWLHTNINEIRSEGFESFENLQNMAEKQFPVALSQNKITSGAVFTNNPQTSLSALSILIVGSRSEIDLFKDQKISEIISRCREIKSVRRFLFRDSD